MTIDEAILRLESAHKQQNSAQLALLTQLELLLLRVRELRSANTAMGQELVATKREVNKHAG